MILAALLLQAVAPGPPAPPAQPHATMVVEPAAMLIATLDADGDGRTTRAELDRGVRRTFATVDRDGKGVGYIVYSDWAERWLGDRNALPSPYEVDANGDDKVSADELLARMTAIFDRLDRDRDGAVTRAECLTIRASTGDDRDRGDKGKGGKRK